jgi:hypothetical protein
MHQPHCVLAEVKATAQIPGLVRKIGKTDDTGLRGDEIPSLPLCDCDSVFTPNAWKIRKLRMKVFIEDKGTGKFLKDFGEWTRDLREAKDFGQSRLAIEYCVQEKLNGVCLLLLFGIDGRVEVRMEPFAGDYRSGTIERKSRLSK